MRLNRLTSRLQGVPKRLTASLSVSETPSWRAGKTTAEKGYGGRWQKYREQFLQQHPLCRMCYERGFLVPATVVDHIVPHRGDERLFWDAMNHQPLCVQCHNVDKARIEREMGYL